MSDPRLNDPRFDTRPVDPAVDPALRRDAGATNTWAWIGGLAAVVLIAILVLGNWHSGSDTGTPVTANTPSVTAPAGSPARNVTPPSTTGSGATSPSPMAPAPSTTPAQRQQ